MSEFKVLGFLPARGGSKGVPGKNLRQVCGRPLIAWAASALSRARSPVRRICSTDDPLIAAAARKAGLEVPWVRPNELAMDDTPVADVIIHAIYRLQDDEGLSFSHVALVQATSPTVEPEDIDAAVDIAVERNADTVVCGCLVGHRHPSMMFRLGQGGQVRWLLNNNDQMARRQELEPIYLRTGLVYVVRIESLLASRSLYGSRVFSLSVPHERALTIDDEQDFKLAELMLGG